jgi:hypothetical protein
MKRWLPLTLAILCAVLLWVGVRYFVQRQAQKKHEVAYQEAVHFYQQILKPGMTRKEVEDYLHAKNKMFRQICCIDSNGTSKNSWDDEVKIGEEDPPWVCGENNVYVGFAFIDNPSPHGESSQADDLDRLKSITLQHHLEKCL